MTFPGNLGNDSQQSITTFSEIQQAAQPQQAATKIQNNLHNDDPSYQSIRCSSNLKNNSQQNSCFTMSQDVIQFLLNELINDNSTKCIEKLTI